MAKVGHIIRPHDFGYQTKGSSREALTFALLETVRLVLEGHESEDELKSAPGSPGFQENFNTSSEHTSSDSYIPAAPRSFGKRPAPANKLSGVLGGPCAHCGATESPQWRRPLTKKVVLCNACGIYYSRHHSLPKRKKMAISTKAGSYEAEMKYEDSNAEQDLEVGLGFGIKQEHTTLKQVKAECDAAFAIPGVVAPTDSSSSADCIEDEALKSALDLNRYTLTNPVSMPVVSGSTAALCSSALDMVALPRTPKRRADHDPEWSCEAAVDTVKHDFKRAAIMTSGGSVSPNLSPASSPSVPGESKRPVVTTALTAVPLEFPVHIVAHPCSQVLKDVKPQQLHAAIAAADAAGQPLSAKSEQSADSDFGVILIPMSTCRGPRQTNRHQALPIHRPDDHW